MLLRSVYSLILLYIKRYTHTHSYIKSLQEILPYDFYCILYICLSSARKQILSHNSQKLHTFLKTWQLHMTLLKTQDGGVLTTRNTLMNYLHHPLTHITLQVLCTAIQNYLSPQKHHYFIYYLLKSLRIFKFGYPASNIVITSSPSSRTLILCVTPFSSQSLKTYGNPITI